MVVLSILDPNRAPILENRAVFRHAVRNARAEFCQVERGVGVMANAKEKHLPIQLVHTTDGAFGDVGRQRERVGGDLSGSRTRRREGEEVIASQHAGQSPECVRDDSEIR